MGFRTLGRERASRLRPTSAFPHPPDDRDRRSLAIWTAKWPAPPAPPLMRTFAPRGGTAEVAQGLQRRAARDGQRSRFSEIQGVGLPGGSRLANGELPVTSAAPRIAAGENRGSRLEIFGAGARRYDRAGNIRPRDIGEAQANEEPQLALADFPVQGIHAAARTRTRICSSPGCRSGKSRSFKSPASP